MMRLLRVTVEVLRNCGVDEKGEGNGPSLTARSPFAAGKPRDVTLLTNERSRGVGPLAS
jgi:hypothetical protein